MSDLFGRSCQFSRCAGIAGGGSSRGRRLPPHAPGRVAGDCRIDELRFRRLQLRREIAADPPSAPEIQLPASPLAIPVPCPRKKRDELGLVGAFDMRRDLSAPCASYRWTGDSRLRGAAGQRQSLMPAEVLRGRAGKSAGWCSRRIPQRPGSAEKMPVPDAPVSGREPRLQERLRLCTPCWPAVPPLRLLGDRERTLRRPAETCSLIHGRVHGAGGLAGSDGNALAEAIPLA